MKILVVSRSFFPKETARAIQLTKLICGLASCGHEIEVVAEGSGCGTGDIARRGAERATPFDFGAVWVPAEITARERGGRISAFLNRVASATFAPAAFHDPATREWTRRAVERSNDRMDAFRPDLLLTISNPIESHAVGLVLKQTAASSIPWITFFSDPRPNSLLPGPYAPPLNCCSRILRRHQNALVRDILSLADQLVVPNRYQADLMERGVGVHISNKTEVIAHIGSAGPTPQAVNCAMTLAHIGNVTKERCCMPLLAAVERVKKRGDCPLQKVVFLGHVCQETCSAIRRMAIESCVELQDPVSFQISLAFMQRQHALLLIEAPMTESPFLPSKFADYVASNRPIIAITPRRSAVRDYLSEMENTWAVQHDSEEIEQAIRQVFALPAGTPRQRPERKDTMPFGVETIASRYSDLLERVRAA